MLQLKLADISLDVVLVRRKRKSIGIRIVEGRVEVAADPRVSLVQLQRLLEEKRDWIDRHWRRQTSNLAARQRVPLHVTLGGRQLALIHQESPRQGLELTPEGVLVRGAVGRLREQVADFLFDEAARHFPARLDALAGRAVRIPRRLSLSSARTRWGSCTSQDAIRLNWRLIQAPVAVLDYVIAHELAHLRHMNHSAAFWAETARLFPDWKPARVWLKQQGETLFVFG